VMSSLIIFCVASAALLALIRSVPAIISPRRAGPQKKWVEFVRPMILVVFFR
jgi:hypothetical protein